MVKPSGILIGLTGAFIIVTLVSDGLHWQYVLLISRPLTSFFMIALAWMAAYKGAYQVWIVLGLVCALVGDIILLWSHNVLWGSLAFLFVFTAYIMAFTVGRKLRPGWFVMPYVYVVYSAVIYTFLIPGYGWHRWPVLLYFVLVLTMGWLALDRFLAIQQGNIYAVYGTVLLILAIFLFAINRFLLPFHLAHVFMSGLYFPAQLLIALSVYKEPPITGE